ncbi:beta-xylosidase/alpha-L-arabinofuranosidase 1 [Aplysia californica]|uniref:Beta-xylosidase/alpha-L-arabinofuranosidase 1 n=1 Tax=Aplysia californica TaxID=6500 RepID=A0ABM1VTQ9_APLCA|nr:beta-xylosidase/alpha-L-arabinofuranosidase 1 [Aplysia californica]
MNRIIFIVFLCGFPCSAQFPFRNTSLPWDDRVNDLVGRLTIPQIAHQMARGGQGIFASPAPAINELGIGPYSWNTECLAGDVKAGSATAFPQPIGMASTFSPGLVQRVAEAIGVEVRAKFNDFNARRIYGDHKGASCFSPVINIMRDPRWGRNQETFGEDPFLSGELAASFVQGLQGDHPRYIRANAGCKHFDVYAGPENIPVSRMSFNAIVSDRDWKTTFLPAFRRCVTAGTYSLMCSYNSINGVPSCANKELLTNILRNQWGFKGYVVSDDSALENIVTDHKYKPDFVSAAGAAVSAGVNLEISPNMITPVMLLLESAIILKLVDDATVRSRVKDLFYTRMRLGEFDPPEDNPYAKLGLKDVLTPEHVALTEEAAAKTIVLLKNQRNALPLKTAYFSKIAVVGPMGDNPSQMYGKYSVDLDKARVSTPRQALTKVGETFAYASGCERTSCKSYNDDDIKKAVQGSEVVVVALGTGSDLESEGNDRSNISLPGQQLALLQAAVKYAKNQIVILLLFSAGPLNVEWAEASEGVSAILQMSYPAQACGTALVRVLLNENGNSSPAGRLPYTWYKGDYTDLRMMTNYSMVNRTYRYASKDQIQDGIQYPFGYGLAYGFTENSGIVYTDLNLPKSVTAGDDFKGSVTVQNNGLYDVDEAVQIYLTWEDMSVPHPALQLVSFDRVHLTRGGSTVFSFDVTARNMAVYDAGVWKVLSGAVKIYAGGQQPGQTKKIEYSNVLEGSVLITDYAKLAN